MAKPPPPKANGTPNQAIDAVVHALLKRIGPKDDGSIAVPEDVAVKILAQAIQWEKVKHHIKDGSETYSPENL